MQIFKATADVRNYVGTDDFDYVDYRDQPGAIVVDLTKGTVTRSDGTIDYLTNIDGIMATQFDDTVIAYGGPPYFGTSVELFGGNNTFIASTGTEDCLQYPSAPSSVYIDLQAGIVKNGYGGTDTIIGQINGVEPASRFNDTILGNDNFNSFRPGGGDDYVDGRGGRNQVVYDDLPATKGVYVNLAQNYALDQFGGKDTLLNIHNIVGTDFVDTIILNEQDNYVDGRAGADTMDGGAGKDSFGFSVATSAVYVNLATGIVYDGTGSIDRVSNFEGSGGTRFNDIFVGSSASETFLGADGDDLFFGGGGKDTILGGNGIDTVIYSSPASSFKINVTPDGALLLNLPGGGFDFFRDVEFIRFADGMYDAARGQIVALSPVQATPGADVFFGTNGDDRYAGGLGDDNIDGRDGIDTAVYSGLRSAYSITRLDGVLTVSGPEGSDILSNIERLEFSNGIVAFDLSGHAGEAYRIYQAAFDRTPDRPGLSYWVNQMDDGMPLSQVALNFILSPEFAATYGNINAMSNAQFVNVVYQNVLHRAPDTGGFNYWMNDLSNGYPRHYMLAAFSQSAENQANVAAAIQNGILLDLGAFI